MLYIYDILLNFNGYNIIDFYEWENDDLIYYIKKIPIYRVSNKLINDIMKSDIIFEKEFLDKIYLKTDYSLKKEKNKSFYMVLLSDIRTVIALKLLESGEIEAKSSLLLEDELEILNIVERLDVYNINYKIGKKLNNIYDFLTREERKIKSFIINELKKLYNKEDKCKLSYYYYEYFNDKSVDINYIYNELIKSMNNEINIKHLRLYELIKLSYQKNS